MLRVWTLGSFGVKLLGQVPQGLPPFGFPAVHVSDLNDLLPLALGCFLLGMVETAALGRMFAAKHGYRFDPNQELLGIASANVMAGLGHGFPVSGGMSQSLVNESGGARTPLSGFIASLTDATDRVIRVRRIALPPAARSRSYCAHGCNGPLQGSGAQASLAGGSDSSS